MPKNSLDLNFSCGFISWNNLHIFGANKISVGKSLEKLLESSNFGQNGTFSSFCVRGICFRINRVIRANFELERLENGLETASFRLFAHVFLLK